MNETIDVTPDVVNAQYAGFWLRLVAALIDGLVTGAAAAVLAALVGSGADSDTANLINLVGGWLYFTVMESSSHQATLGKKALGLWVTDDNGQRISFARANGRYWSKIISVLILLVGFIMIAFTARKQGLHDIIAHTLVLRK